MNKTILAIVTTILLSSCSIPKIATDTTPVQVPLLYCPAPPDRIRPLLAIHSLTNEQLASDGELVKAYAISISQLQGHVAELEAVLDSYDRTNAAYEDLRRRFEQESQSTGVPE